MPLTSDIISQFVKATKVEKEKKETTHLGTIVKYEGRDYVKLDGSDYLTPIEKTTNVADGERVNVTIKNHTATVTGNISSPAARTEEVENLGATISEFETIIAHKVVAEEIEAVNGYFESIKAIVGRYENAEILNAEINKLYAKYTETEYLKATDIDAINMDVERIQGMFAEFEDITAEDLEAVNAEFTNLTAYNANFTYVSTEVLEAMKGSIQELDVKKLTAEQADLKYANIDFSNINEAAVVKIFSESGIIKDLIVDEGKITGELVGVTIKGDLIEGNTVKADKLVVLGSDGIYYKLNIEGGSFKDGEAVPTDGLHGSVIVAKSITADRIAVTDLVAFGATIGGFKIGQNSIYSGVKESVGNSTRGIYMDNTGQMNFGDSNNYIKFFQDTDGTYRLEIAAETFKLGPGGKNVEELIEEGSNDKLEDLRESLVNSIDAAKDDIKYDISKEYVNNETYNVLTTSVQSTFEKLENGAFKWDFTGLEQTVKDQGDASKDAWEEFKAYIEFTEAGHIVLGKKGNQITLDISNDQITFLQGSNPVAYFSDQKLYITKAEIVTELIIGNYKFTPRDNGSVDFKKWR